MMVGKSGFLKRIFRKHRYRTGLHHYRASGSWKGLRLHLRIEEDGSGVLVINASRVLFLNPSAAEHVYLLMQGRTPNEAAEEMSRRFKVNKETALKDHEDITFVVNTFAKTTDVCPISYLGIEKIDPFSRELSAPYRMDLALTYLCNNRCLHCYTGGPRETKELSTNQWSKVLDKLHEVGIPHVVFTGGEPTLREDLPDLVEHAEGLGLVSGLVTNGRRLSDAAYLDNLVRAGIDHIQITIESHQESVHDKITGAPGSWKETVMGLRNAIATPVYTLTNTTLNRYNVKDILKTVDFLHNLGLEHFACNGLIYSGKAPKIAKEFAIQESEFEPILKRIRDHARGLGMEFIWYTPTEYCVLDPLSLELGMKCCSACHIAMAVEPDGKVIPCQSYFEPLGNILTDDWKKIWNHPVCQDIRGRKYAPEKCVDCPQLSICGAGCPLKVKQGAYLCVESLSR